MSLRTRLLGGYAILGVFVFAVAAISSFACFRMVTTVRALMTENVASIRHSVVMLESLERQDSIMLQMLRGAGDPDELAAQDQRFRDALREATDNVTVVGEREKITSLTSGYEAYVDARSAVQGSAAAGDVRVVESRFSTVRTDVIDLIEINHSSMMDARRQTTEAALTFGMWTALFAGLSLIALLYFARALTRTLVDRLLQMSEVAAAVQRGERHRRFSDTRNDELGRLGAVLNDALDRADGRAAWTESAESQ